jgi:hypothetical protein
MPLLQALREAGPISAKRTVATVHRGGGVVEHRREQAILMEAILCSWGRVLTCSPFFECAKLLHTDDCVATCVRSSVKALSC